MTPNVAIVHIHNPYWRGCRLWIPLFLLWIPVILLSPLLLLILLPICFLGRISLWGTISTFWGILCALPGTDVRVEAQGNHILIEIL
jgi:hypothetical protein